MTNPMEIRFPGGLKVDAHYGPFVLSTDQPVEDGGDGSAPSPFRLFLAALGTCAGFYVVSFLRARDLPTEGLKMIQDEIRDPDSGVLEVVALDIFLPQGVPAKYHKALIKAASLCTVKRHVIPDVRFEIRVVPAETATG
jgi:ribosomal protein S12 methylthiotransferase accessory factor